MTFTHRPAGDPGSRDPFVIGPTLLADGSGSGPLFGTTFAVKDLFDVAGTRTGAGNPARLEDAEIATEHAEAVQAMLLAGAVLVGKTVTDELAFSLSGTNVHYGTPLNPVSPDRVPGGSSSGSASAVAAGLVDFALGTDTGGSVRVPSSYCGVVGLRTTHGRISQRGVMLLAPSFCTVGLFARGGSLLERSWQALRDGAGKPSHARPLRRLVVAPELFALADADAARALEIEAEHLADHLGVELERHSFATAADLETLRDTFRVIQFAEAWEVHGDWLDGHDPGLGPGIAARFAAARGVDRGDLVAAREARETFTKVFADFLGGDSFLLQPAASGVAPLISLAGPAKDDLRTRTLTLTAVAGLVGAPVVSLPLGRVDGLPVGLALVGRPGDDDALVEVAKLAV